ncbi:glutathione S-transferase [Roridomyces roridus]|uniref:glutathione transferase n=1 Tax=Roridomyces roridus TaxID=1738132 RepID=A0AAD7BCB1_9AGAR|nr:glutathione S-transferase [Roridomyces roridus]
MVLKVYGPDFTAGGTGIVVMTLFELRVPFELVYVDMYAGEHKHPEHLARQPFGMVPAIDDDGFILFESRAICRYLVERYLTHAGGHLCPPPETDLQARAKFEQAASMEYGYFEPHARVVYRQAIIQPLLGLLPDEEVVSAALEKLAITLNVYDGILAQRRFLCGEEFSLVDLFHVAFGAPLAAAGCDYMTCTPRWPNVARWWKEITERPSFVTLGEGLKRAAKLSRRESLES